MKHLMFSILVAIGSLPQFALAVELTFPKEIECGNIALGSARPALIYQENSQSYIILRRPIGLYRCNTSTESTGFVECPTVGTPEGLMPEKISASFSPTIGRWVVNILNRYHYECFL